MDDGGDLPSPTPPTGSGASERYEHVGMFGAGGGGEVRRVRDARLDRFVAMKVQRWGGGGRFAREARVLARLQHPAIVALFDVGALADGRMWFTMPEVRGRTLGALVQALHEGSGPTWGQPADGYGLKRLVRVIAEVALAIAHAHERGVVHRDLHPGNVMVGAFGQVQVVDWGIARLVGEAEPVEDALPAPEGPGTRHGARLGTPAYMAPEQASGEVDLHGPATDCYALGALLDTLLTGGPPYPAGPHAWRAVLAGPPEPAHTRARSEGPPLPEELVEAAQAAMHRDPDQRMRAVDFARALQRWLDDTARGERAQARLDEARVALRELSVVEGRAVRLEERSASALAAIPSHAPVSAKRDAWLLEAEAGRLRVEAGRLEAVALEALHGALHEVPDLDEAHQALADRYRVRLDLAERHHATSDAALYERLVRVHDRGTHAAWLDGAGKVWLDSAPPGAPVVARPFVLQDRQTVPGEPLSLGRTPIEGVSLPHGSWLLEVQGEHGVVGVPVFLERLGEHRARPPGSEVDVPVPLVPLQPDECLVPAGWFVAGGDPQAREPLPERRVWLDAFVVQRDPVTVAGYLVFLQDLLDRGERETFEAVRPCWKPRVDARPEPVVVEGRDGLEVRPLFDQAAWLADQPVVLVDWYGARAYAAWLSRREERPWRLPHELEWEKAARGVDARHFPWGDAFDPAFTRMVGSHEGEDARPVRVGELDRDSSPYRVRGLAGNVWDWCANVWADGGLDGAILPELSGEPGRDEIIVCRGGGWTSSESACRSASRAALRPGGRTTNLGFRLVRSVR